MKIRNLLKRQSDIKEIIWRTCAAVFLLAFASTAFAEVRHGQYYLIKSGVGNFYMSGEHGNAEQKTRVSISNGSGKFRPSAIWQAVKNTDGTFTFVNYKSSLALDVQWGDANAGTAMHFWPRNGGIAQKFRLHSDRNNYYTVAPALNPNLRLDVYNGLQRTNTPIQTWHANSNPAQKWRFEHLDANSFGLAKISKEKLLVTTNAILKTMRVKLDTFTSQRYIDKNDDVSWYVPQGSALRIVGQDFPINIPEINRGARDKRYYVEDVNLRSATAKFFSGDVIVSLEFEHNNQPDIKGMCSNCIKAREDNGAPDFRFVNNKWDIRLGLIPWNGSLAFEFKSSKFLGDIAGGGLGLRAEIAENKIVPEMSASIKTALEQSRNNIARQLKDAAHLANISVDNVRYVVVDGDHVFLIKG